jgi:hypothetical protein
MKYCDDCETADPVMCIHVTMEAPPQNPDPVNQLPPRDRGMLWTVTTLNSTDWYELSCSIDTIVQPASYAGASFNGYSGMRVMAGNMVPTGAGAATPWMVVPAGKAIKLPPGTWKLQADQANNRINVRIFDGRLEKRKWLSKACFLLPPTNATVGVASALALAARAGRGYLYLKNTHASNAISLSFGDNTANPAVLNSGITLGPGEPRSWWGDDCPEDQVNAIAGGANTNLAIQEG